MTNSRFYKEMLQVLNDKECSMRELAAECNVSYLTFLQFFNPDLPFKTLRPKTKAKIHNHLGISYEIMNEYNKMILEEKES